MNRVTVTIRRSGGFAGMTREWSASVDLDQPEWRAVLERLPWDEECRVDEGADRFIYLVSCERRKARIPETSFTGPWEQLLEMVREHDSG